MFCTRCGADCTKAAAMGAKFCNRCGAPLPEFSDQRVDQEATTPANITEESAASSASASATGSAAATQPMGTRPENAEQTAAQPTTTLDDQVEAASQTEQERPVEPEAQMPSAQDVSPAQSEQIQQAPQTTWPVADTSLQQQAASKRSKKPLIIGIVAGVLVLAIIAVLVFVVLPGGGGSIVGKWEDQENSSGTWEFASDGKLLISSSYTDPVEAGTYTTSGDTLTLKFSGDALGSEYGSLFESIDMEAKYNISGNTLSITPTKMMGMDVSSIAAIAGGSADDLKITLVKVS